jgi:hypothetical protein
MAQAPGTPAQTEGVAAQGQGQEPAMATPVDAAPTAEGSPMAPTDDPVPSPAPAADAITDTNRERMSVEPATGTLPAAEGDASPQDRDAVPLETEPAPPTVPSESPAEGRPPVAEVPADAQGQPADASPLPGGSPSSNPEPDGGAATAEPTRPPSNAYGYREPQDKYPPPESEPAPEEAKPHPVQ